jgi:hypothetical protein
MEKTCSAMSPISRACPPRPGGQIVLTGASASRTNSGPKYAQMRETSPREIPTISNTTKTDKVATTNGTQAAACLHLTARYDFLSRAGSRTSKSSAMGRLRKKTNSTTFQITHTPYVRLVEGQIGQRVLSNSSRSPIVNRSISGTR